MRDMENQLVAALEKAHLYQETYLCGEYVKCEACTLIRTVRDRQKLWKKIRTNKPLTDQDGAMLKVLMIELAEEIKEMNHEMQRERAWTTK